ncbi:MAG: FGGY-family carbohydrate kinase [Gammaproteobacteria bacterium]|nr:FGGY-family carbohydrate kinase [Gammaproteobacteria bacterium]
MSSPLYLGIDIGTSGVRAVVVNADGDIRAWRRQDYLDPGRPGEQDAESWWDTLCAVLDSLADENLGKHIAALGLDATSGTVVAIDHNGDPLAPALMYNDARAKAEAERIARLAPRESAAHGAGSGLAKALTLRARHPGAECVSQADWILRRLGMPAGHSDQHNMLKWGWDPLTGSWPAWLSELGLDDLPTVHVPGTPLGRLDAELARRFRINPDCRLCAATTDSNAAFVASGASRIGEAVTSLGSTLVTKVLSATPVFAPEFGVYSHPFPNPDGTPIWVVGGGSNSGGAVLKQHFCNGEMQELSARVEPDRPTGLDYYPLPGIGERFPVNDPDLAPRLTPRPADDAVFFQAMLEGMARIEQHAYRLLAELGAPYPTSLRTAGGGAHNAAWSEIRHRMLGVKMLPATQEEAAYGAALLTGSRSP